MGLETPEGVDLLRKVGIRGQCVGRSLVINCSEVASEEMACSASLNCAWPRSFFTGSFSLPVDKYEYSGRIVLILARTPSGPSTNNALSSFSKFLIRTSQSWTGPRARLILGNDVSSTASCL